MRRPEARGTDRPRYPEYREQFGENPARFVYANEQTLRARINGLRNEELVRAYLDVETDRDEPRRGVVAALNSQLAAIHGEVGADGGEERGE